MHVKLAILYVKIPDTLQWEPTSKSWLWIKNMVGDTRLELVTPWMSFKCATNCANRPFYLIVKSFSLAQLVLNLYRLRKLALTNRPFYLIVKSLYLAGAINCTLLFSFQNSERQDFPNFVRELQLVCICSNPSHIKDFLFKIRNDRIWTCDPYHPKVVRYQAALRPEKIFYFQLYQGAAWLNL